MLGLKKRHQCSDQRFCRIRAPCVASTAARTEGKEEQMTRSLKREKRCRAKNGSLRNTSTDSKAVTFVILKSRANALIRKERSSQTSEARREASRNKFVEKGEVLVRMESFGKVDRSKNRLKARLGFVKLIQNELRKIKDFDSE